MARSDFLLFIPGVDGGSKEEPAGAIDVLTWSFGVSSARDSTGQATGRRVHEPLVITKAIDKSSPVLIQYGVQNTLIASAKLELRHFVSNKSTKYFEIEIKNARVRSVQTRVTGANLAPVETVSFVFSKIEWTFVDGGISAQDDWERI